MTYEPPDDYLADDPDEHLARTEEALQAERDEIDALASEDKPNEREDLGFDLAWWDEDNDVPAIDTVSDLANGVCGMVQFTRALNEHGYPRDAMSTQVTLNHVTGPLVVAALQILGSLHHHLRDEIKALLVDIHAALPVMTEEEQALYADAHSALAFEQYEQTKAAIEASGIPVISLDEAAEMLGGDEAPDFDSGLN